MEEKKKSKAKLDSLLEEFKAQPVGKGYIDIIVSRENYRSFASALLQNGFEIEAVSWWEYIDKLDAKNNYGMGGPASDFYPGWFAEVGVEPDEIQNGDGSKKNLSSIIDIVENKVLWDGISYKETHSLTPAFWLKVDADWENERR